MKLSSVFTRIALSVGLLVSVNAFAQNAHLGVQTIPHKAVVAHQSVANNPTHAMDMDQGCNKIKPSCDMPQKAQEHKAKQSKSAHKKHASKPRKHAHQSKPAKSTQFVKLKFAHPVRHAHSQRI